jgi:hypothetical protein
VAASEGDSRPSYSLRKVPITRSESASCCWLTPTSRDQGQRHIKLLPATLPLREQGGQTSLSSQMGGWLPSRVQGQRSGKRDFIY